MNKMGVNVNFLTRWTADTNRLWFGWFAVWRIACAIGPLYTVNSITAVQNTDFAKNIKKNV